MKDTEIFKKISFLNNKDKEFIICKVKKYVTKSKKKSTCPYCSCNNIVKNGNEINKRGEKKQRYFCKNCKKSFRNSTGTFFENMRQSEKWFKFLENTINGISLRKMSKKIDNITHVTLFRWRKKLILILNEINVEEFFEKEVIQ
jgi:hypothetical protein